MSLQLAFFVAFGAIVVSLCGAPVMACIAADYEDHHAPVCEIPLPETDNVVALYGGGGQTALSDLHLGYPERRTRVVDLHVAPTEDTHFLMLTASDQTIWRISGATDAVGQVVVLGARQAGADAAGVIGVPPGQVHFTDPDLASLEGVRRTSCTRISPICSPAQWFNEVGDERLHFHPERPPSRMSIDMSIRPHFPFPGQEQTVISVVPPEVPDEMLSLEAATIVSVNPPQPYAQLPGRPGLDALVREGALIPAERSEAVARIAAYSEQFSARYRSRFDPDFYFVPDVDYIITRDVTLPPQLPPTAFLLAAGVDAPEMNGNDGYTVCFFREDEAPNPFPSGYHPISPLCRAGGVSRTLADDQQVVLRAAAQYDALSLSETECRIGQLPADTHVIVLAVTEPPPRRYVGDPFEDVVLEIRRDGPVALYLASEAGPIRWHVNGSDVVEIYARLPAGHGSTETLLNGVAYAHARLTHPDDDCPQFPPLWPTRLGPAIAHLDLLFERLEGRGIDEVILFDEVPERIVLD